MEKYNKLLTAVSQKYEIARGEMESELSWKIRIIYSICGMMAYTSLWDDAAEEQVSIIHLKRRVHKTLASYRQMYPEILPYISDELENEISSIFLNTGVVYHCPNRIAPSIRRDALAGNVCLQRGVLPDNISCVSGIGFYSIQSKTDNPDNARLMFGLEEQDLLSLWETTLSMTSWQLELGFDSTTEYLRIKRPFSQGYWVNTPDVTGRVSMLRTGRKGSQPYYLYKYTEGHIEVSPLPHWRVSTYNYRTLTCACLARYGMLPPIEYSRDGALVHIRMNYLLPPRELEFIKLYSWPEVYGSFPCNFRRKCSASVFSAIHNILVEGGYSFKEGWSDA